MLKEYVLLLILSCWIVHVTPQSNLSTFASIFLQSIEKVSSDIVKKIPGWQNYIFNEENNTLGFERNRIEFLEVLVTKSRSNETIYKERFAFNADRSVASESFDVGSRTIQPFTALLWVRGDKAEEENATLIFEVVEKQNNVNESHQEVYNSSFLSDDLSIRYFAVQTTYRNSSLPSICKIYFYVEGHDQSWYSNPVTALRFFIDPSINQQNIQVTGNIENALIGFLLIARQNGNFIQWDIIDEIVAIILNSFPRVLCNPSQSPCEDNQFDCRCGKDIYQQSFSQPTCIPGSWRCDGSPDCPHRDNQAKDEENCICPEGFFQCGCDKGGAPCPYRYQCIPNSKLCDRIQDCESYKDEGVNECAFNCTTSGESIRDKLICDGKRDCQDFSDEMNCAENPPYLPYRCDCNKLNEFSCTGNNSFYSETDACNRVADCSDSSDELNCTARQCPHNQPLTCNCNQYEEFNCTGNFCFKEADRCDGWIDCSDGTDEENCTTQPKDLPNRCSCGHRCGEIQIFTYKDDSGILITIKVAFSHFSDYDECDGMRDCSDRSDEACISCPKLRPNRCMCNNDTNQCERDTPPCFTNSEQCNEEITCHDKSDEWNCSCPPLKPMACPCKRLEDDDVCIGDEYCYKDSCDGVVQCPDLSDESQCELPNNISYTSCGCLLENYTCPGRSFVGIEDKCDEKNDCGDWSDEWHCNCTHRACNCNKDGRVCENGPQCYSAEERCNGMEHCKDGTDEENCTTCPERIHIHPCFCNTEASPAPCDGRVPCYKPDQHCDAQIDCTDASDEWGCSCVFGESACACKHIRNTSLCLGRFSCYPDSERCNGNTYCPDGSDEWDCKCKETNSSKCACKLIKNLTVCLGENSCFTEEESCDTQKHCEGEVTDERNCACFEDEFTCSCFTSENPSCPRSIGCIPEQFENNGKKDCPNDGNDDPYVISVTEEDCGNCKNIKILVLQNIEGCSIIGLPNCDSSTCATILSRNCSDLNCNSTEVVCLSHCSNNDTNLNCKTFFQCNDKTIRLGYKFCNGISDCPDRSDEIENDFGFKCRSVEKQPVSCVLPQRNLFDSNTPQCFNGIDVNSTNGSNFFECFDKKLIISKYQLCDGVINCFDLSDECLCRNNLLANVCQARFRGNDPFTNNCGNVDKNCFDFLPISITEARCLSRNITCATKYGERNAILCDKIPECSDLTDECNPYICNGTNLPAYCNDDCHSFYPLGERYCNGFNDPVWMTLNNSDCYEGFDEKESDCPKRFYCLAGDIISIPVSMENDGNRNCDDGSDENRDIFSSDVEMIRSKPIRIFIWIIAFVTLFGNSYVFVTTINLLQNKRLHKMTRTNHTMILNLAVADFMMGIYLLIISIQSAVYSGYYGEVDLEWRASSLCIAAGSLAFISSETSCFIMSTLSTFRLINLSRPVKSLTDPTRPWLFAIAGLWVFSFFLAMIPLFPSLNETFVSQLWLTSPFSQNRFLLKNETLAFVCRYASSANVSYNVQDTTWNEILTYLNQVLPSTAVKTVGFYGDISVCMPRFYVDNTDTAAGYSIFLITLNFISFIYVCISYIYVLKITSNRPISNRQVDIQNQKMQKRIARLLITDFFCWIPICLIAFVKYSTNEVLPNDLYAATIAFLLPINSALNPLLYSPLIETLLKRVRLMIQRVRHDKFENSATPTKTMLTTNM